MIVNITALPSLTCLPISLSDDSAVENTERFDVLISSDDPAVSIGRAQSTVFIEDSTRTYAIESLIFMSCSYFYPCYSCYS